MYPSVVGVEPLEKHKLLVRFDTGESKTFDLSTYLDHGLFAELRDIRLFKQVHVSFDSIEWPNGIDLDPEVLYKEGV
jgi:hypothetical protein